MLFTRKIGAALRGKATPLQVMLATVLGGLLGFVPGFFLPGNIGVGFAQAPGLILLLLCAVLVMNANLAVFGLTLLVAKLLSYALLPISYSIGTWLLDGPISGLFGALVNSKVTAWFGLEYYATTGGLVLGLAFGALAGVLFNRTVRAIRHRMADVEANSERYQKYSKKWWVRLSTWLLLGKGKGKQSWQELSESHKRGLPIRILGVVVAVVLVGGVWVFQSWFSTPLLTSGVKGGLVAVNGATVDLETAELALGGGTLRLEGLAIADQKALGQDLFAADAMVATIDMGELLRRRLVIDEVRATNARSGSKRAEPGVRIDTGEATPEPPPAPAGQKTIEDYLEDFELWKGRLEQLGEWIDGMAGGDEPSAEPTAEEIKQQREEQEAAGLATVVARHLLHEQPRFVIRKVDIEGIGYSLNGKADKLDLRLRNISDAPSLLADVLSVSLAAQSDTMNFLLTGPVAAKGDQLGVDFAFRQLPVDAIFGQLRIGGAPPVSGGTLDLAATGALGGVGKGLTLDLPLQVTMKDTTFAFASMQPTKVDSLLLPIGLSGPLTRPAVSFDDKVLQQSLLKAGQAELANFVQQNAGKLLGSAIPIDLTQDPSKILDDAKKKAEDEAKKAAEEAAKKLLPGGLKGLLGGKKGG